MAKEKSKKFAFKTIFCAFLLISTGSSYGSIKTELAGSTYSSGVELEDWKGSTLSGTISFGLTRFFYLGITHFREYTKKKGFKKTMDSNTGDSIYYKFSDNSEKQVNSLDLTVIVYHGLISPYLLVGYAEKSYISTLEYPTVIYRYKSEKPVKTYQYGGGFSIYLNQQFQLKITHLLSPGERIKLIDEQEVKEKTLEPLTKIGLQYTI